MRGYVTKLLGETMSDVPCSEVRFLGIDRFSLNFEVWQPYNWPEGAISRIIKELHNGTIKRCGAAEDEGKVPNKLFLTA